MIDDRPCTFSNKAIKNTFYSCYRAVVCLESIYKKKNLPFSSRPKAKPLFILLNAENRTFGHPTFQS